MPTEVTTSIEQLGQNLDGQFAARTPNHQEGGWVRCNSEQAQLAAFAMAIAASVTGKQLEITYEAYSQATQPGGYKGVTKMKIV